MINEFFQLFFTLLIILDPLGILPTFLSTIGQLDKKMQKNVILRAIGVASGVCLFFIIFGKIILNFFGISPGAFYISGGILFFVIAYGMIWSKPGSQKTPKSSIDPQEVKMLAVFPLAIPLIAGPGTITTIMLNMSSSNHPIETALILFAALTLALIIEYVVLRCGTLLVKIIGTTGMYVIEKIMGLILAGLAIQLIYNGLVILNIL